MIVMRVNFVCSPRSFKTGIEAVTGVHVPEKQSEAELLGLPRKDFARVNRGT